MTLGWIIGKPMSLLFDPFESVVLFLSGTFAYRIAVGPFHVLIAGLVLVVNYTVQDGKR